MAVARRMPDGCVLCAAAICASVSFPSVVTVVGAFTGTGAGMCEASQASRTVAVPLKASASTPPAVPHCHSSHDFHGRIRPDAGAAGGGHANHSGHPVQDVRGWPTLWLVGTITGYCGPASEARVEQNACVAWSAFAARTSLSQTSRLPGSSPAAFTAAKKYRACATGSTLGKRYQYAPLSSPAVLNAAQSCAKLGSVPMVVPDQSLTRVNANDSPLRSAGVTGR